MREASNKGKYEEAEKMLREEVLQCEKALGQTHPLSVMAMSNMGRIYKVQGKFREAEMMYQAAYSMSQSGLGLAHLTTMAILGPLGLIRKSKMNFFNIVSPHPP